jgi:type III restriction enzyme
MSLPVDPVRIRRAIAQRLSLRAPQEEALRRLSRIAEIVDGGGDALAAIRAEYPEVESFERDFPSLAFALATGVGKTRLMGAFVAFLFLTGRSKNFFVLAPNTTIYDKLVADFSRANAPKYVFRGIAEFAQTAPIIVTSDNWKDGRGVRGGDLFGDQNTAVINIFNIDRINRKDGTIRGFRETIGESYFDYLGGLPDLVMLMDEAHRYRASAGFAAIAELKPKLGLELTATPKSVGANGRRFKNIVYEYGLGNAMADGFVKEPAVATRADFRAADHSRERLETIMLEDGVHYHEHVRAELDLYARQTGRTRVYPFMLVVAQDTSHAGELKRQIEDDGFFGGAYKGRVIEVHSALRGEESDEAAARLVALETAGDTDIVIHVNKLKEGWDVTNLYTIVPLRASASDILTEQTLGRGLRLPYGERTGVEAVDTLTVIAHDRFDEVIKRAREADSLVQVKKLTIGAGGDIEAVAPVVVSVPTAWESALTGIVPGGGLVQETPATFTYEKPVDRQVAKTTIDIIRAKYERQLPDGVAGLARPEVRAAIAEDVRRQRREDADAQGEFAEIVAEPDIEAIIEGVTASIAANTIEIPEIVVLPSREVNFWFDDFELTGLSSIRYQPISDRLLIRSLREDTQRELARPVGGAPERQVENYIVRHLIDYPEVDYDTHADLLYRLAGQVVGQLRSYLANEADVENVALSQGEPLARMVFEQMKRHQRQTPAEYKAKLVRAFRALEPQQFGVLLSKQLPLTKAADPLSSTSGYTFYGSRKSPYLWHKFHSDAERRFACMIDSDREPSVEKWLKPGRGQFQIEYQPGRPYEPDFVIETGTTKLIVEVKARKDLADPIVMEKARAADAWVGHANTLSAEGLGKRWQHVVVPDDAITESATLAGLTAIMARG